MYAGFIPILLKYEFPYPVLHHDQYLLLFPDKYHMQLDKYRHRFFILLFFIQMFFVFLYQFTVNEFCHELVYRRMTEEQRRTLSPTSRFGIALGSGVTAGFAAAVLSHVCSYLLVLRIVSLRYMIQPADTLLSQVNIPFDNYIQGFILVNLIPNDKDQ